MARPYPAYLCDQEVILSVAEFDYHMMANLFLKDKKEARSHPNVHNEHQRLDQRQVVVVGQARRLARTQENIWSRQREGETARENYFREPVCSVGKVDSNLKERRKLFL